jgi:hypothetical protein
MLVKRKKTKLSIIAIALSLLLPLRSAGGENDDYLTKALNDSHFSWESLSNAKNTIYFQKNSFASKHRVMLLSSLETSISTVLDLLDETEYTNNLNVVYLETRGEMEAIIGKPYSGFANWSADCIFLVVNPEWRSFERHEFAHIVTMGLWGRPNPTSGWMIEGIPVYCDGWCQDYSVLQIANFLLKAKELPELNVLIHEYFNLGEIRAGISSASFVGFILNKYGPDKLKELWRNGSDRIEEILDDSLSNIEKHWIEYIKQSVQKDSNIDYEAIKQHGCG